MEISKERLQEAIQIVLDFIHADNNNSGIGFDSYADLKAYALKECIRIEKMKLK